jgi:site-specific DNA-methyltransferase (adenine-specific)
MLLIGDCVEQMRTLDAESVDAVITDPPYGLTFMGKDWDNYGTPLGFQQWTAQWAAEAYRVLKPGGYLLAFGGTRTYHRLAAGVEDAGFEIRDCLLWLYGSGFPKSLDVSKAIDKAAGAERVKLGRNANSREKSTKANTLYESGTVGKTDYLTAPATDAARDWEGWGTALKPAVEPIVMARKPLIGTVAENVQRYGTGAININATRVGTEERFNNAGGISTANGVYGIRFGNVEGNAVNGRWPANVLLDEEAAAMLDEQSGESVSQAAMMQAGPESEGWGLHTRQPGVRGHNDSGGASRFFHTVKDGAKAVNTYGDGLNTPQPSGLPYGDSGGASRFFYVAKAARAERNFGLDGFNTEVAGTGALRDGGRESKPRANTHPTVKPVALMAYLIRMVARKGSVILDPFMGSGTTAVAAIQEGVAWIGCEREAEYVKIINGRIAVAQAGLGLTLAEQPDTVALGGSNLAGEPPTINAGEELELWRE